MQPFINCGLSSILLILLFLTKCIASSLTVIIPFGQGGGSHQFAINVLNEVKKIEKIEIKIINVKGNNGINGTEYYMKLPPNGIYVLQQTDILPAQYATAQTTINPAVDLVPVSGPQIVYSQLYVSNIDPRFHDWKSFVKFGMDYQNKLAISTIGSSDSLEAISMRMLSSHIGLKTRLINFDEPALRYMALIEGEVDALFEQPGDVAPFLNRDLIKPILTFLSQRPAPFLQTNALGDINATFSPLLRFRGFFVNSTVNKEKIKILIKIFESAFQNPTIKKYFNMKYTLDSSLYRGADGTKQLVCDTINVYKKHFKQTQQKKTADE
ncbi:MAG: hypothetical protein GY710_21635 [Desulfobacteraceae bacterium]|nr:hypothetical protein [Desulfobacteraceae bacterium]